MTEFERLLYSTVQFWVALLTPPPVRTYEEAARRVSDAELMRRINYHHQHFDKIGAGECVDAYSDELARRHLR